MKTETHIETSMNEPIPVTATEPLKRNLMMGLGFLPRLRSAAWWKLAIQSIMALQEFIWKPAVALGCAFTAPFIAYDLTSAVMRSKDTYYGLGDVLQTIALPILAYLAFGIAAIAAAVWGLSACLVGSTALCKTFLTSELETISTAPELKSSLQARLKEAIKDFRQRKAYLFSVWAMYLVFITIPSIVMLASAFVVMLGMAKVGGMSLSPLQLNVPTELMIGSGIALAASLIAISNYTLILMPCSSVSKLSGTKVAVEGLTLSLKVFLGITIYSTIVFFLSNILIAPVDLLVLFNMDLGTNVVMRYFLFMMKGIWHAFFFAMLMPMTVLIPCEMVRGNIE